MNPTDLLRAAFDHAVEAAQAECLIPYLNELPAQIIMAVAGFTDDELSIESNQNELTVSGDKAESAEERKFLHRGIANRGFERKFQLADHVFVKGARLEHGLLHIELYRELPEALKPRSISIETGKLIENQA